MRLRGEFQGFVGIRNLMKEQQMKQFTEPKFVHRMVKNLPWDPMYNKRYYEPGKFEMYDVICFASSGTPIGLCLPLE